MIQYTWKETSGSHLLVTGTLNPLTAMMLLEKRPIKVQNLKPWGLSVFLFAVACERFVIQMHGADSGCVIGPQNTLFQVCVIFFSPEIFQALAVKGLILRFYIRFCPVFLGGDGRKCFASFMLHILTHCGTVGLRLLTGWLSDFTHGSGGRGFLPHVWNQLGATPGGEQREGRVQQGRFPMSCWVHLLCHLFFSVR